MRGARTRPPAAASSKGIGAHEQDGESRVSGASKISSAYNYILLAASAIRAREGLAATDARVTGTGLNGRAMDERIHGPYAR